jgi:polysaccharide export outer membrane protein
MVNKISLLALIVSVASIPALAAQAPSRPAAPAVTAQPAADLPAGYVIGAEDVLGVVFWREAEISGDVTVRPDGRITLPVIGEMEAAGLRPEELQKNVLAAAAKYITDANVAVVVRAINSRKIYITGRVTNAGPHPLKGPLTVMQAIALAGGLTEYADAKNITILRVTNGQTESFKLNYRDVAKGKGLEQNIPLQPGDTVIVP